MFSFSLFIAMFMVNSGDVINVQIFGTEEVRLWKKMNSMEGSFGCVCAPIYWFEMFAIELHGSFVLRLQEKLKTS